MMPNKPPTSGDPIELKISTINNNMLDQYTGNRDGPHMTSSGIQIPKYHSELIVQGMLISEDSKLGSKLKYTP